MSLSPIAQYCIRKLLKQNIKELNQLFIPNADPSSLSDKNLDRILNALSLAPEHHYLKIQELELLANLYQKLEQNPADQIAKAEIRRRIFQALGFRANTGLSAQLPSVVPESLITKFRFFHQNQVKEGMRYENSLFAAIYQFEAAYRLQAYQIAWVLSETKVPLILSISFDRLIVWVNLQSPTCAILMRQNDRLLKTVLSLNSKLRQWKSIADAAKRPKLDRSH